MGLGAARTDEGLLVFNAEEPAPPGEEWATYRYRYFIRFMRRSFAHPGPVCPLSRAPSFDMVLRSNSHQIKLNLDGAGSQFMLLGYHQIEYNVPSYISLVDRDYSRWERDYMLEGMGLGQAALVSAVNVLATAKSCSGLEWLRSLIIVRLMICDASNSPFLLNFLAAGGRDNLPSPLPQWIRKLVIYHLKPECQSQRSEPEEEHQPDNPPILSMNDSLDQAPWSKDSDHHTEMSVEDDVFDHIDEDDDFDHIDEHDDFDHIDEDDDHLGEGNPDLEEPHMEEEEEVNSDSDFDYPGSSNGLPYLRKLPEVFFVRISGIEGKDSGNFYGTIYIGGEDDYECIYNRKRPELVHSGDIIFLSGPSKYFIPPDPEDSTYIHPFLMGERVRIPASSLCICCHDLPICKDYHGKHCSLTLCYTEVREAMRAALKVTFVDDDNEEDRTKARHARVYGRLSARCEKDRTTAHASMYDILLFQKRAEEHVDVSSGRHIKLLRDTVCVSMNSKLIVHAELFEYNADGINCSFDQEVAKGVLEFPLRYESGSLDFEHTMYRKSGKIQVKVVWMS